MAVTSACSREELLPRTELTCRTAIPRTATAKMVMATSTSTKVNPRDPPRYLLGNTGVIMLSACRSKSDITTIDLNRRTLPWPFRLGRRSRSR